MINKNYWIIGIYVYIDLLTQLLILLHFEIVAIVEFSHFYHIVVFGNS